MFSFKFNFTTIVKKVILTYVSQSRWHYHVAQECGLVLWGKPECPEKTHLSGLLTQANLCLAIQFTKKKSQYCDTFGVVGSIMQTLYPWS